MHVFCQVSNLLGLFPVVFLVQNERYWLAFFLLTTVVFSIIYHMDETNFTALLFDVSGCTVLLSCLFYLVKNSRYYLTGMTLFSACMLSGATACFVLAGSDTRTEQYGLYHTAWHVFSMYGIGSFMYSYVHTSEHNWVAQPLYPYVKPLVKSLPLPAMLQTRV